MSKLSHYLPWEKVSSHGQANKTSIGIAPRIGYKSAYAPQANHPGDRRILFQAANPIWHRVTLEQPPYLVELCS